MGREVDGARGRRGERANKSRALPATLAVPFVVLRRCPRFHAETPGVWRAHHHADVWPQVRDVRLVRSCALASSSQDSNRFPSESPITSLAVGARCCSMLSSSAEILPLVQLAGTTSRYSLDGAVRTPKPWVSKNYVVEGSNPSAIVVHYDLRDNAASLGSGNRLPS